MYLHDVSSLLLLEMLLAMSSHTSIMPMMVAAMATRPVEQLRMFRDSCPKVFMSLSVNLFNAVTISD